MLKVLEKEWGCLKCTFETAPFEGIVRFRREASFRGREAYLVIGGAYSIDAYWRIRRHAGWWKDEQPSDAIKAFVEAQIATHEVDIVLYHTCPRRYEPVEVFLPNVNQSSVDKSTEDWLDTIEAQLDYKAWYCGHWHTDKRIDKMHFLFTSWETIEKEITDETD